MQDTTDEPNAPSYEEITFDIPQKPLDELFRLREFALGHRYVICYGEPEKFAMKACKSAIKSGDRLTDGEVKILTEYIKNNLALTCPHGRPVAVRITRTEIDKWFKRIV